MRRIKPKPREKVALDAAAPAPAADAKEGQEAARRGPITAAATGRNHSAP
ncbi:MAG: hypothetical protein MZV63_42810 [Marinilabiliales bacterium]|nr:hypothetical protein [Marinilabiliales bacterium]